MPLVITTPYQVATQLVTNEFQAASFFNNPLPVFIDAAPDNNVFVSSETNDIPVFIDSAPDDNIFASSQDPFTIPAAIDTST